MGEEGVADEKGLTSKAAAPKAAPPKVKVLGPVANLEEHVRPDWWRDVFNSLYLKTDGDVVDDPDITRKEVDLFAQTIGLSPEMRVLDLCCGQGRHCAELARRGFLHVEGLDRSHYLVQRGRAAARKESLPVRLREGDARKLPYPPDVFDAVLILGNSFGYFETVNEDLRVLKEVRRVLKPWGRLLIDVAQGEFVRQNFQPRSWEWIDSKHFVCRERSLSADKLRLISREVITHVEDGVLADQFYAERLYDSQSLTGLLEQAGFSDCTTHGTLTPESRRNQDLGMMRQRILISAQVRKEWAPVRKRAGGAVRKVIVVMGDPSRPDSLKPASMFDDDDFYTIDQLKGALNELDGYSFDYLSKHDTLIDDLRKCIGKTDLVLNLCDEGYNNDPHYELHVPALLEALGLPYTGGGPQCLAFCYDKSLVRGIASEMNIPVPSAFLINPEESAFDLLLSFPVIVKPNFGDSSFGITQRSVATTVEHLANAILEMRESFGYDKPILVEEFLTGKDLTVGILGNPPSDYTVLPIVEEDYSVLPDGLPQLCGYEAKWVPDSPYWKLRSIPANLPEDTQQSIVECSLRLIERLACRDYVRLDWRLNAAGEPHLLEVNPNPGWCWDGHLAKMSRLLNMSYGDMLAAILRAAETRLGMEPAAPSTAVQKNAANC